MDVAVDARSNSTALGPGNGKLVNTQILSGDLIVISCNPEDVWKLAVEAEGALPSNANGLDNHFTQVTNNQNFRTGSMVGSFNDGKTFFPVGTLVEVKALEGETPSLTLWCADSDSINNSGTIVAQVTTYRQASI